MAQNSSLNPFLRSVLKSALALPVLLGCSAVPVQTYQHDRPELVLEDYLKGDSTAYGVFTGRSGEVKKRFVCKIHGDWDGSVLTLREDFIYSDQSTSQRIWKIRKVGPKNYVGTAADVVGEAIGEASGNAFYWKYTLALPVDGKTYHVKFDDWMYLMDSKVMLNKSAMSKWGFHLGDVTLSFVKP